MSGDSIAKSSATTLNGLPSCQVLVITSCPSSLRCTIFETFSVSDHCPMSKSMPYILVFFFNDSTFVSAIYCCIANYHQVTILFAQNLEVGKFRMTSAGQLVSDPFVISWGQWGWVSTSGMPHMYRLYASISVLLDLYLAPHGVSSSTSCTHGFCFSQHGTLRVVVLLHGSWLPRVSVPHDNK